MCKYFHLPAPFHLFYAYIYIINIYTQETPFSCFELRSPMAQPFGFALYQERAGKDCFVPALFMTSPIQTAGHKAQTQITAVSSRPFKCRILAWRKIDFKNCVDFSPFCSTPHDGARDASSSVRSPVLRSQGYSNFPLQSLEKEHKFCKFCQLREILQFFLFPFLLLLTFCLN